MILRNAQCNNEDYYVSSNQNVAWKSNDTWDSHGDVYNVYLQRTR
jgi:uncharacterized protein YjcR